MLQHHSIHKHRVSVVIFQTIFEFINNCWRTSLKFTDRFRMWHLRWIKKWICYLSRLSQLKSSLYFTMKQKLIIVSNRTKRKYHRWEATVGFFLICSNPLKKVDVEFCLNIVIENFQMWNLAKCFNWDLMMTINKKKRFSSTKQINSRELSMIKVNVPFSVSLDDLEKKVKVATWEISFSKWEKSIRTNVFKPFSQRNRIRATVQTHLWILFWIWSK